MNATPTPEDLEKAAKKMPWYGWVAILGLSGGGGGVAHQGEKICRLAFGDVNVEDRECVESDSCCATVGHLAQQCETWRAPQDSQNKR